MTEKVVLMRESRDEMLSFVCHDHSMAENGADCKRLCALCRLSQLVEDLRFANQHAVDLGCFVSLAFA